MVAPAINPNRKAYNGKPPKNLKKVQWVLIRREETSNIAKSSPFRYQPDGIEREIKDGTER